MTVRAGRPCADVTAAVMPLLAKNGLSFSAKPTLDEDGRFVLAYSLRHTSGESDGGVYPLPSGNPQQVGSALTYARRYILSAIVGVAAEEDDDGRAAKDTRVESRPQKHWDPTEQSELREQWELEIAAAKDDAEIADIGKRLLKAKRGGEISPATYEHLAVAGGRRKAELNGGDSRAV